MCSFLLSVFASFLCVLLSILGLRLIRLGCNQPHISGGRLQAKLPQFWASSDASSFLGEILMVNFIFFLHFLKLWQPSWYSPDQVGMTLVSRFITSPLCMFRSSAQCFYRIHQTQLLLICPKAHTHVGIQSE